METKKVAAYARVSTDKDDQANSLDSQKAFFTEHIMRQPDWEFVGVYADEGITGTSTKKRKAFNQMIEDAKAGKIDVIITKEVSRFARNTVDTLTFTRLLKEHGVEVQFVNDNISSFDCDGELRLTLMASISQEESRKTSDRVKWGQKRRMEQGVVFGNREMLGFHIREGKLIINEDDVPIIQLIFHKYLNENKGNHTIARELDIAGIRPKRGKHWSGATIMKVLRNEKYAGDLCQRKSVTTDYLTHKRVMNNEDMVYIENHHEPIIERAMWNKVQAELARRRPDDEIIQRHSNRYWCSGKIWCGECGGKYASAQSRGRQSFRCYKAIMHGRKECSNQGINSKALVECIKHIIRQLQVDKEKIIAELESEISQLTISPKSMNVDKLRAEIDDINIKKDKAIKLVIDGFLSTEDLKRIQKDYNEEIADIEKKVAQCVEIPAITSTPELAIKRLREIADMDFESESVLGEVLEKVVAYPNNVLKIWLKDVPMTFNLQYKTTGYKQNFKVDVNAVV